MFKKTNEIKKNKSEKENKNKKTIKVYKRPIFLIVGLIALIAVTIAIYMIFLNFKEIMRIEYDGYAISGKEITENLLGNSSEENKNLSLIPVKEQDKLYKKLNSYFIGENKRDEINLEYPIYINNNSTMYNLSQNMVLITNKFEEIAGYPNLTATNGGIYNQSDLERMDNTEYFFLKNEDNVYTSLKDIKITTVANEYMIPLNSSIYFDKEAIRYYEIKEDKLIFKEIGDIDNNSKVQIGDKEVSYQELLTELGIIKEEKQDKDIEEEIIKEDTSKENQTKNEEIKKEENEETNKEEEKEEVVEGKYIKPEVNCSPFEAEVYTMSTVLAIQDPSKVIQGVITFEIKKDGKVYLRKTYTSSGEIQIAGLEPNTNYEIEGRYIYLNEQGQKIENTFYRDSVTTKGLQELKPITLSYENGEIFANKVQITKLKITSNITEEAVKGVKRAEVVIGNASYEIKVEKLRQLVAGQEIIYETSEGLKSDSKISYEIKFYDKQGNEIKLENSRGESKTAKQKPSVSIRIAKQNVIDVTLGIKLNNKDRVEILNYRYVITKPNGDVVKESGLQENDGEIFLNNLDPNQYYSIKIYGNYDLNNNKGIQENQVIGETVFATQPLSTLGYVNLSVEQQEVTTNSGKVTIKIDEDKTDKRLIQILKELKIRIINKGKNNQTQEEGIKEDTIISETIVEGEELQNLKQGDSREESYENLESNTKYEIKITAKVSLGETIEEVQTTYDLRELITLKKPTEIQIKNLFVTGDMIDFDVRIEDQDIASLTGEVRMELRDEKQNLIKLEYLDTNKEYERKTFEKLELNKTYTLSFYANQYNEGSTDSTYHVNYLVKQMQIYTESGITGNIALGNLKKQGTGKNLIDVESKVNWHGDYFDVHNNYGKEYDKDNHILKLYCKSNGGQGQDYLYDLKSYIGKKVTISFKAKKEGNAIVNLTNGKVNLKDLTDTITKDWIEFEYTTEINTNGMIGFDVGSVNNGEAWIYLKDLQIELGEKKTSYEPFQYLLEADLLVNLQDTKQEITTKDYYISIVKDGEQIEEIRYEDLTESNSLVDVTKTIPVEENSLYKFILKIKIGNREYILSEQECNTNKKEIKGIRNKEDYLQISPEGNYIVLGDIDLEGYRRMFTTNNYGFSGHIDFNGYTLRIDSKNSLQPLFARIEKSAIVENFVLSLKMNNITEIGYYRGLAETNYGTIRNFQLNLMECNNLPNTGIIPIAQQNYGTIENFVIHNKVPLYGARGLTMGINHNYGMIQNGYLYGENIKAIYSSPTSNRETAGLVIFNYGTIENIFGLINIDLNGEINSDVVGNLVCYNNSSGAQVKNAYSVGNGKNTEKYLTVGPTVGMPYNQMVEKIQNVYYFSEVLFKNSYNLKTTPLALYDSSFQKQILGSEGFEINSCIEQGYYPQVKLPTCMPKQEYILLPEVQNDDLPDILSTETIEQGTNRVKVKIRVHNPSAETVTSINIKNITCQILSQQYENGASDVVVELANPVRYVSEYAVLSITTKGAYNLPYTREFQEGERKISADLYREIHNVEDWKQINKSPTENYQLMTDLNFINEGYSICITNVYQGILNGNGHTIKNINIDNNTYVIREIKKELKDLLIENCQIEHNGAIGFIANAGGKIENVHIRNMTLRKTGDTEVNNQGGLMGVSSGIVENCSIQQVTIENQTFSYRTRTGGLVGVANGATINNSYVQNLTMIENNAFDYEGVGGLVGAIEVETKIKNCYVTGKIETDAANVGGIVGYFGVGSIKNCYSKVDIMGSPSNFGGIIGSKSGQTNLYLEQNLSLGNLYTSQKNQRGARISTHIIAGMENKNYAYANQKINGEISNITDEAILLTQQQLEEVVNYQTIFNTTDSYSYEQVEKGILPKLYKAGTKDLLPNQEDIDLEKEAKISLNNIEMQKTAVDKLEGKIIIDNPDEVEIINVIAENLEIKIVGNQTKNSQTYLTIVATPTRFYDTYKLIEVTYLQNQEQKKQEIEGKIEIQFYKELYTFEDWQSIEIGTYQNYRLMNDIDFTGKTGIKSSVTMAKLEAEGEPKTLRNIILSLNQKNSGLIQKVTDNMNNINFENINITNTGSGFYTGIIAGSSGPISNIQFKNITIQANNMNYVGCIGYAGKTMTSIQLDEVNCSGKQYVGGLSGYATAAIKEIDANHITIYATSNFVGGISGYVNSRIVESTIKNSNIKGENYTGGIAGVSYGDHLEAENVTVEGNASVGGIIGQRMEAQGFLVGNELTVKGKADRIGGLVGGGYGFSNAKIMNSTVIGQTSSANYIGGIIGYRWGYGTSYSVIENVDIVSKGNYVGGLAGYSDNNTNICYVKGTTVEGNAYVGGVYGKYQSNTINYTYVQAKVTATSHSAGGFIGYLNNLGTNAASNSIKLFNNYVVGEGITAPTKVGGFIGEIAEDLYTGQTFYYNNYVQADVIGETDISLLIGNRMDENPKIQNTYLYQYSTINGENPNIINEPYISDTQYLKEIDLKEQKTYTEKLKWNSYFNFSPLVNNKYPILNGIANQEGIDLPKDSEHIVNGETEISLLSIEDEIKKDNMSQENEKEKLQETFEYEGKKIETYETYSVIANTDGEVVRRKERLYVKDGKLYVIDGSLDMVVNNLIVDSYNGKEYETILGTDGKLYDLKDQINYPENFVNEKIKTIGNNLHQEEKEITVIYEDGSKVTFNYQTGEVIEEQKVENNTSLLDYLKEQVSTGSNLIEDTKASYEENKTLMSKLQTTPIEKAMELKNNENRNNTVEEQTENTTNSSNEMSSITSSNRGSYITVYNSSKKEFEVYKEEEILDIDTKEVVSENEKIEKNNLNEYYIQEERTEKETSGIVWVLLSITGAVIVLFVLWRIVYKGTANLTK